MQIKKINKAFTLIEILVGIIIVSFIFIGGFQALSSVTIGKSRIIQETDMQKESFYFTQKLFEMIKKGGTLDYEEYFNRKSIGNNTYSSGHFNIDSGFGNYGRNGNVGTTTYGDLFYYCRSGNGTKMGNLGCLDNSFNTYGVNISGSHQRYGQYSFQFIDYNSNYDDDNGLLGDEDGDGEIRFDDDDEYIGDGPTVFDSGTDVTELYLISGDKLTRTFFRWNLSLDPYAPPGATCGVDINTNELTGSGCIGTVEYLKLEGKDWGLDHDLDMIDETQSDGVIDTWIISPEFVGGATNVIAGANNQDYRIPLFPNNINVAEFKIYAYPNTDVNYTWKSIDDSTNISPYITLKLKILPSWISRKKVGGEVEELDFSMTINLTDIYSQ